jgi:enoyl-CoA hydratase/carnithine racemase
MAYEAILVEKSDAVATVTLNRPKKLNAINATMLQELEQLFRELREDTRTRLVIFTGAGQAFSAGADLTDLSGPPESTEASLGDVMRLVQLAGQEFTRSLESLEQVTIAAVNGHAMGAGLVIAMACDFRVAARSASLGIPEANVGIFFTWGCTPRLTRLIGPAKAKEMIMTCEPVGAEEALRIGLVNRVVDDDDLMGLAHELAATIGRKAPLAVRMTKKIVNAGISATSTPASPSSWNGSTCRRIPSRGSRRSPRSDRPSSPAGRSQRCVTAAVSRWG